MFASVARFNPIMWPRIVLFSTNQLCTVNRMNCMLMRMNHQYHTSSVSMFAVRRRSRGGVPRKMDTEEGIDDLYPARKLEKATNREFDVAAAELMDELFDGLKPLRAHNDNLVLTRGTQEETGEYILIDLGPGYGQYNIQVDNHQSLLLVSSPITGPLEYIFLKDKQEWCSVQDGHNFKGLLMRDLIRQVNGLPKL